ncbi:MAG TPA: hypothetical protein VFK02_25245 [Kofleriaceae bacterium]|nr:hypothetical protein [Kofleriaceae bacterium]
MRLVLALAIVLAAGRAAAHVAPAIGDNNRYLKLTPLGDRLRLAYTVLYGAVPAEGMRRAIDANHDGAIDDAERRGFGDRIAREVAAAIELTIDGVRRPVAWSQVDVGLGAPGAAAGPFPVDLVAWICLAAPRGKHAVVLRDDFRLERPGETEVKVEDTPGVAITATRIGGAEDDTNDYNLVGPSGALATYGLELQFTAGDRAPVTADATCAGPATRARPIGSGAIAGVLVVAAIVAGVVLRGVRRRRGHARAARDGATSRR